jgi:hypothetical protein
VRENVISAANALIAVIPQSAMVIRFDERNSSSPSAKLIEMQAATPASFGLAKKPEAVVNIESVGKVRS